MQQPQAGAMQVVVHTQALMPLVLAALVMFGVEQAMGWRIGINCTWPDDGDSQVFLYWKLLRTVHKATLK